MSEEEEEGMTVPVKTPTPTQSTQSGNTERVGGKTKERKVNPLRRTGDTKKRAYQSFVVPPKTSDFIVKLPKVELHVHLPGAFDLEVSLT